MTWATSSSLATSCWQIDPTDYRLAAAEASKALELELAKLGLREIPRERLDVAAPAVGREGRSHGAQRRRAAGPVDAPGGRRWDHGGGTRPCPDRVRRRAGEPPAGDPRRRVHPRRREASAGTVDTLHQKIADATVLVPGTRPTPAGGSGSVGGGAVGGHDDADVEYVVTHRGVSAGEIVRSKPGNNTILFRLVVDRPLKVSGRGAGPPPRRNPRGTAR